MWKITKWFCVEWYQYLFHTEPDTYNDISWFTIVWCRIRNHPKGVWWYNPNALEPDMHCKNCGDYLG